MQSVKASSVKPHFAWFVLALNLVVILWGAVVRATGAGAGCGEHWPLCNGAVVPPAPQIKTLIEYGHRLTSGLALLCVVGLVIWAYRSFPKDHIVRRTASLALFFEVTEGLIGAGLVLLGHVANNASVYRGYSLGLHLTNTLLLLGTLALTAWFADRETGALPVKHDRRSMLIIACLGIAVVAMTGAITALGDTLFASATLAEGMQQDFSAAAHPFVRLRILHPILASLVAALIIGIGVSVMGATDTSRWARKLTLALMGITVGQLCLGAVNLLLMAPVPIQILHLLLADLLWIALVLLSAELLAPNKVPALALAA